MVEPSVSRKQLLYDIVNRYNTGERNNMSANNQQDYGEKESDNSDNNTAKDPGVQNLTVNALPLRENSLGRRRTHSQPGPVSGSMLTATAARAARRKPQRNVMYASGLERSESYNKPPKILVNRVDDSGTATPPGGRGSPLPANGPLRNGDAKLNLGYRIYTTQYEMRGGVTPRKRSVATMDAQSIRSIETHAPPPTSPEDNKKLTNKYISLMMSSIYAIFLTTLGFIVYIAEPFIGTTVYSNIFSLILCTLGIFYHLYLVLDIGRYKSVNMKNASIKEQHQDKLADFYRQQEEEFGIGGDDFRSSIPPPDLKPISHDYCFNQGRHSGSFYLKVGASAFAMGHLVHSMLLLAVQIGYYFDSNVNNEDCVDVLRIAVDIVSPIYCFLQIYFIFKYSNVIILRAQGVAHFAFMHIIGSSLCFWIFTIVRETMLALTLYANTQYPNGYYGSSDEEDDDMFRIDVSSLANGNCTGPVALAAIYENFSPYLFPFSVEFNILIVAVYYIIWSNIGHCPNEDNNSDSLSLDESCNLGTAHGNNDYTSNIVIYADCHASNRGLFLGMIVMVFVLGMLILGFVFNSVGGDFPTLSYTLNDFTRLALHSIMLVATVIAFNQTRKLDINEHPISILDDILLFVCLPAFFMETVFSVTASISYRNIVQSIDFLLMVLQVLVQTPLLIDGLRRCSNTRKLRRNKPGREIIMFLLIANVSLWVYYTLSYKSPESLDDRYQFYGKVVWTILGHISLPLIMFYRFHSSVCFSDIWDSAYKPGSEH